MANYDDDQLDEVEENDQPADGGGAAAPSNNRNFLLALGVLGGLFVLAIIALAVLFLLNRKPTNGPVSNVDATNQVIMTANAQTAAAATTTAGFLLTPSVTPTATMTPVPPTATNTQVVVKATASSTGAVPSGQQVITLTPNLQTRTATIGAVLTLSAQQTLTRTAAARLTGTATNLPKTGFAEDVGLPGLFGLAIGFVIVIVLVRRLRLSTNG
jgi:hypothetical protein